VRWLGSYGFQSRVSRAARVRRRRAIGCLSWILFIMLGGAIMVSTGNASSSTGALAVLLASTVAAIAVTTWFKRRFDRVRPQRRSPRLVATALKTIGEDAKGLSESDLAILGALIESGSDLSERRHVVHYLYCSSEDSAWALREEASANGFTVQVAEPQMTSEPTERELRAVKKEIASTELVEVIPMPVGPELPMSGKSGWTDWRVRCEKYEVLSPSSIRSNAAFFMVLAEGHGAVYDGWEAAFE
jgi:hypothetical protein